MGSIDRGSPVPIYQQIKAILLDELSTAGEEMPKLTEGGLMKRFHVSRAPVRQALNSLVTEGYFYRERAKGTYPTAGAVRNASRRLGGLMQYLQDQGMFPTSEVLKAGQISAPVEVREVLNLPESASVFAMERLIFLDETPIVWVQTYLNVPEDFKPTTEELEEAGTVISLVERGLGISFINAEQQIWASAADEEASKSLLVEEGSPVLVSETSMYSSGSSVIGWSRALHLPDVYKYVFPITR